MYIFTTVQSNYYIFSLLYIPITTYFHYCTLQLLHIFTTVYSIYYIFSLLQIPNIIYSQAPSFLLSYIVCHSMHVYTHIHIYICMYYTLRLLDIHMPSFLQISIVYHCIYIYIYIYICTLRLFRHTTTHSYV